jgi:hypothetical protein
VRRPSKGDLAVPFAFPGLAPPASPLRGFIARLIAPLHAAFHRIHAAHPGIVPALSEFGWRSSPAARLLLSIYFFIAFCAIYRATVL